MPFSLPPNQPALVARALTSAHKYCQTLSTTDVLALAFMGVQLIGVSVFFAWISYFYNHVMSLCVMVEDRRAPMSLPSLTDSKDDVKDKESFQQCEMTHDPATSSMLSFAKHVKNVSLNTPCPCARRWPGFKLAAIYTGSLSVFAPMFFYFCRLAFGGSASNHSFSYDNPRMSLARPPSAHFLLFTVFSGVLFAPIHCAWTHSIVGARANKSVFSRISTSVSHWRKLWFPSVAVVLATHMSALIAHNQLSSLDLMKDFDFSTIQKTTELSVKVLTTMAYISTVQVFLQTAVVFPLTIVRARVEASLLPSDETPIVRVNRELFHDSGDSPSGTHCSHARAFRAALPSLCTLARTALLKMKVVAMQAGVISASLVFLAAQTHVFLGPESLHKLTKIFLEQGSTVPRA